MTTGDGDARRAAKAKRQVRHAKRSWRAISDLEDLMRMAMEADEVVLSGSEGPHRVEVSLPTGFGRGAPRAGAHAPEGTFSAITLEVLGAIARESDLPRADHFKEKGRAKRSVPETSSFEVEIESHGSATVRASANASRRRLARDKAGIVAAWLRRHRNARLAQRYVAAVDEGNP